MAVKIREKNGRWWLYVDWRGQRKAKCVGTKEAAEKAKVMLEARLLFGADVIFEPHKKPDPPPPPVLFGEYARSWIDTFVALTCKRTTVEIYDRNLRVYLAPVFGKTPLAEISRERIIAELVHPLLAEDASIAPRTVGARGKRRRRRAVRGTVGASSRRSVAP